MSELSMADRVAALEVEISSIALEGLSLATKSGWTRESTVVRLRGGGEEGLGEDVCYQPEDQQRWQREGPGFELRGRMSLRELSQRLDGERLFSEPPQDAKGPLYRRWAIESAALDLALRQAGTSLASLLGRQRRPLRYVVSMGLGSPPSMKALEALWARYPELGLKLDASLAWDEALIAELAASGKVACVDLKGQYKGAFTGTAPDGALYTRVAEGLPDAWLEDPGWTKETKAALADHMPRVTYDAPICSLSDLLQILPAPRAVNIKPSRFGRVIELLRVYATCEARGITMYGGGQFEIGVGRGQIQHLASLFHPNTANDVAPAGFNDVELPDDLPSSPLLPPEDAPGFR